MVLAYDPVTKAVFSVNSQGALCQLPVKIYLVILRCNIVAPDNMWISSQVVSDNQGNIYAMGSQPASTDNFVLKYQTSSNTWTSSNIDIPFSIRILSFSKLLYRQGKLYLTNPNLSTLYTINLSANKY